MSRWYLCGVGCLIFCVGCEQMMAPVTEPPQRPVAQSPVLTEPESVVAPIEESVVEPPAMPAEPAQPVDPPSPPPMVLPQFAGSVKRLVSPTVEQGKRGAKFEVVTQLQGDNLGDYQYDVLIRDARGSEVILPAAFNGDSVVLNEFIAGAGVQELYEFQVRYRDPETKEFIPLRPDQWSRFRVDD